MNPLRWSAACFVCTFFVVVVLMRNGSEWSSDSPMGYLRAQEGLKQTHLSQEGTFPLGIYSADRCVHFDGSFPTRFLHKQKQPVVVPLPGGPAPRLRCSGVSHIAIILRLLMIYMAHGPLELKPLHNGLHVHLYF